MAAIAHTYVEQATEQTTTSSTYANVSGAQIASSNFVAGGSYLLLIAADLNVAVATADVMCRITHGGTAFADSEQRYENQGGTVRRTPYFWFHVWTAVASEAIDVQLASEDNVSTATIDTVAMVAIRLDADLAAADWKFAELGTDNPLGTTFEDGASVTWTPATSGDTWLVLGYQQVSMNAVTSQGEMQMVISGGATFTGGLNSTEGEATTNLYGFFFSRGTTLTNVSTTLKVQGRSETADVFTHLHSKVFALRLNAFRNFSQGFTAAALTAGSTAWADDVESESLTPAVAGDVLAITCDIDDMAATGGTIHHRLRFDSTDVPAGQTTHVYSFVANVNDVTDQNAMLRLGVANLTAAAHAIDHDAYETADTAGRQYLDRSMVVFTMELPGGAPPFAPPQRATHRLPATFVQPAYGPLRVA